MTKLTPLRFSCAPGARLTARRRWGLPALVVSPDHLNDTWGGDAVVLLRTVRYEQGDEQWSSILPLDGLPEWFEQRWGSRCR